MKRITLLLAIALTACFPTTTPTELDAVRTGDVVAVTATLKGTLVAGSSAILSWSPVEACKRSETTPEKGIKCASPVKVTITSPTKLSVQVVDGLKPLSGPVVR